jgi:hypothetical protein
MTKEEIKELVGNIRQYQQGMFREADAYRLGQVSLVPDIVWAGGKSTSHQPAAERQTPVDRRNAETYPAWPGRIITPVAGTQLRTRYNS